MNANYSGALGKGMQRGVLVMAVALAASGCASSGVSSEPNPADPWEGFNRRVFAFNDVLDRYALKPAAQGYRYVTPDPLERGVSNFFDNLGEVRTVFNSLLQGKGANAGNSSMRFLMNTTFGLGGLLDPATHAGFIADEEDFGQTLAAWGVGEGPFVVLPFLALYLNCIEFGPEIYGIKQAADAYFVMARTGRSRRCSRPPALVVGHGECVAAAVAGE